MDILEKLDKYIGEDKRARVSSSSKKSYARKWARTNKNPIKSRKEKRDRTSQGSNKKRVKDRNAELGRTANGRKKVRYNVG